MNIGYKPDSGMLSPASVGGGGKDKQPAVVYPSLRLRGAAAKAFCNAASPGDVLEGTVRVKIVRLEDAVRPRQEYGGNGEASVELEIEDLELPGISAEAGEGDEDDTAEGAVDSYLKKKRSEPEDGDELA